MTQNNYVPDGSYRQSYLFTDYDIDFYAIYNGNATNTIQYTNNECANWDDISLDGGLLVAQGESGNSSSHTINRFIPQGSYQNAPGFEDVQVTLFAYDSAPDGASSNRLIFTLKQAEEMTDISVNGTTLTPSYKPIEIGTVWQLSGFFNGVIRFKDGDVLEFPITNDPALQGTMKWAGDMGQVIITGSLDCDPNTQYSITITPWEKSGTLTYNSEGKQLTETFTIKDVTYQDLVVGQQFKGGIIAGINAPDAKGKVSGLIVNESDYNNNITLVDLNRVVGADGFSISGTWNGFSDWRVPSLTECDEIRTSGIVPQLNLNNPPYLFCPVDIDYPSCYRFDSGLQASFGATGSASVRLIRYFKS